tara:strand:- start:164 stop:394 length:231 start_codon:yes stop_codon:yes gene_type:complete
MKDRLKSWETTIIGIIALLGLAYKAYTSGGFEVSDFLILTTGFLGIGYKKNKLKTPINYSASRSTGGHPDPKKEEK